MKLATFSLNASTSHLLGAVVDNKIYSFSDLIKHSGTETSVVDSMQDYLENLPLSFSIAQDLLSFINKTEGYDLDTVKLHSPLPQPKALIDFALTPQHLFNSAMTFVEHEYSGLKKVIAKKVVKKKVRKMSEGVNYSYYKGNHNAVIGPEETTHWPSYTSYLDIEPELAIVTGTKDAIIAGYVIFNDFSARDVQVPELDSLSLTRSKDFHKSNGLGPFLVTPDEIENPLALDVQVKIGDRYEWKGSTKEYSVAPDTVIEYLQTIHPLVPGSVIGLGTIPGCCGLDNNLWVKPGEEITITFKGLGTLKQYIPSTISIKEESRWAERAEL